MFSDVDSDIRVNWKNAVIFAGITICGYRENIKPVAFIDGTYLHSIF